MPNTKESSEKVMIKITYLTPDPVAAQRMYKTMQPLHSEDDRGMLSIDGTHSIPCDYPWCLDNDTDGD